MTLLMLGTPPTLVGSNFNQEGSVLSVVNIHFHTLGLDGVYVGSSAGELVLLALRCRRWCCRRG